MPEVQDPRAHCLACIRIAHKAKYASDPGYRARAIGRSKARRLADPGRAAAEMAAYYLANRERMNANGAAYYLANRERMNAIGRAYYEANRERMRAVQAEYAKTYVVSPERRRAANLARRARISASMHAAATLAEIASLAPWCQACGGSAEEVDHIWPVARGGCSALHNLQWLCTHCNRSKGPKSPEEWRSRNDVRRPEVDRGQIS